MKYGKKKIRIDKRYSALLTYQWYKKVYGMKKAYRLILLDKSLCW